MQYPVYALLSGKTQRIYEILLKAVVDKCDAISYSVDPTTVICDFEQSMTTAATAILGSHINVQPHHRRGECRIPGGLCPGIMNVHLH